MSLHLNAKQRDFKVAGLRELEQAREQRQYFRPQITKKATQLDRQERGRPRERFEQLYRHAEARKLHQAALARERRAAEEGSFQPTLHSSSSSRPVSRSTSPKRSSSAFGARLCPTTLDAKQKQARAEALKYHYETEGCTFAPRLHKPPRATHEDDAYLHQHLEDRLPVHERLVRYQHARDQRLQLLRAQAEYDEMWGVDFQPHLVSSSKARAHARQARSASPAPRSSSVFDRLSRDGHEHMVRQKAATYKDPECTFAPALHTRGATRSASPVPRSSSSPRRPSLVTRLAEYDTVQKARRERLIERIEQERLAQCTFKPKLPVAAAAHKKQGHGLHHLYPSPPRCHQHRDAKTTEDYELEHNCTFKPQLNARTPERARQGSVIHRLFVEAQAAKEKVERMRRHQEEEEHKACTFKPKIPKYKAPARPPPPPAPQQQPTVVVVRSPPQKAAAVAQHAHHHHVHHHHCTHDGGGGGDFRAPTTASRHRNQENEEARMTAAAFNKVRHTMEGRSPLSPPRSRTPPFSSSPSSLVVSRMKILLERPDVHKCKGHRQHEARLQSLESRRQSRSVSPPSSRSVSPSPSPPPPRSSSHRRRKRFLPPPPGPPPSYTREEEDEEDYQQEEPSSSSRGGGGGGGGYSSSSKGMSSRKMEGSRSLDPQQQQEGEEEWEDEGQLENRQLYYTAEQPQDEEEEEEEEEEAYSTPPVQDLPAPTRPGAAASSAFLPRDSWDASDDPRGLPPPSQLQKQEEEEIVPPPPGRSVFDTSSPTTTPDQTTTSLDSPTAMSWRDPFTTGRTRTALLASSTNNTYPSTSSPSSSQPPRPYPASSSLPQIPQGDDLLPPDAASDMSLPTTHSTFGATDSSSFSASAATHASQRSNRGGGGGGRGWEEGEEDDDDEATRYQQQQQQQQQLSSSSSSSMHGSVATRASQRSERGGGGWNGGQEDDDEEASRYQPQQQRQQPSSSSSSSVATRASQRSERERWNGGREEEDDDEEASRYQQLQQARVPLPQQFLPNDSWDSATQQGSRNATGTGTYVGGQQMGSSTMVSSISQSGFGTMNGTLSTVSLAPSSSSSSSSSSSQQQQQPAPVVPSPVSVARSSASTSSSSSASSVSKAKSTSSSSSSSSSSPSKAIKRSNSLKDSLSPIKRFFSRSNKSSKQEEKRLREQEELLQAAAFEALPDETGAGGTTANVTIPLTPPTHPPPPPSLTQSTEQSTWSQSISVAPSSTAVGTALPQTGASFSSSSSSTTSSSSLPSPWQRHKQETAALSKGVPAELALPPTPLSPRSKSVTFSTRHTLNGVDVELPQTKDGWNNDTDR